MALFCYTVARRFIEKVRKMSRLYSWHHHEYIAQHRSALHIKTIFELSFCTLNNIKYSGHGILIFLINIVINMDILTF